LGEQAMIDVFEAIQSAARRERGRWIRVDGEDLTQSLALRLTEFQEKHGVPDNLEGWLSKTARNLVADWLRRERRDRETKENWQGWNTKRINLTRDPLVNYMAVKPQIRGSGFNELEDAIIACVDSRSKRKIGPRRLKTCDQELLAWNYILSKRTPSHKSTCLTKINQAK
jgi:DNA-directed RNA polymerase specialized sigma24 family protein